jgi:hypothetical protein
MPYEDSPDVAKVTDAIESKHVKVTSLEGVSVGL